MSLTDDNASPFAPNPVDQHALPVRIKPVKMAAEPSASGFEKKPQSALHRGVMFSTTNMSTDPPDAKKKRRFRPELSRAAASTHKDNLFAEVPLSSVRKAPSKRLGALEAFVEEKGATKSVSRAALNEILFGGVEVEIEIDVDMEAGSENATSTFHREALQSLLFGDLHKEDLHEEEKLSTEDTRQLQRKTVDGILNIHLESTDSGENSTQEFRRQVLEQVFLEDSLLDEDQGTAVINMRDGVIDLILAGYTAGEGIEDDAFPSSSVMDVLDRLRENFIETHLSESEEELQTIRSFQANTLIQAQKKPELNLILWGLITVAAVALAIIVALSLR